MELLRGSCRESQGLEDSKGNVGAGQYLRRRVLIVDEMPSPWNQKVKRRHALRAINAAASRNRQQYAAACRLPHDFPL